MHGMQLTCLVQCTVQWRELLKSLDWFASKIICLFYLQNFQKIKYTSITDWFIAIFQVTNQIEALLKAAHAEIMQKKKKSQLKQLYAQTQNGDRLDVYDADDDSCDKSQLTMLDLVNRSKQERDQVNLGLIAMWLASKLVIC